ncbi:MAG: PKD domain-containing protein, partial [Thermoplasmatota archaeon]
VDNASVIVFGDMRLTKHIWNDMTQNWVDIYANDIGKIVRFNISIEYQGSFIVQYITVTDFLPIGLEYYGNATVDGALKEPMVDSMNHTLNWNLSDLQSNKVVHIEFDVNITENTTFTNSVRVPGVESIGKHFNISTSARVTGMGPKQIFCIKQVKSGNDSWLDEVNAFVGTVTSFKISLINNGNNSYYNLNILDSLPSSLSYVENSSIIFFNNQTFFAEPLRDSANNMLLWININSVIQDYLDSGENISIIFNASVEDVGLLINTVNVTSTICNECDPLEISDTALVNATMPIPVLHVNAGGPYIQRPMIPVVLTANATGGEPPYAYFWDLNNDSIFDDGNTSSVTITWDAIGIYAVTVKVIDNKNDSALNMTYVNISIPPLMVDAFGPYTAFVGDVVSFHAEASGGVLNYSWYWDFNDGNSSIMQNPSHIYLTAGIYSAIVIVTDQENHSKNDTAFVTIKERDIVPPQIDIEHPKDAIYVKNKPVFPFFTPLVFGEITINISATDEDTSIEKIEIRINDELIGIWYNSSVHYVWSERTIGRYKLYVVAYDVAGNWKVAEKIVWKIF